MSDLPENRVTKYIHGLVLGKGSGVITEHLNAKDHTLTHE